MAYIGWMIFPLMRLLFYGFKKNSWNILVEYFSPRPHAISLNTGMFWKFYNPISFFSNCHAFVNICLNIYLILYRMHSSLGKFKHWLKFTILQFLLFRYVQVSLSCESFQWRVFLTSQRMFPSFPKNTHRQTSVFQFQTYPC